MEFIDEIPSPRSGSSAYEVQRLKENPGAWAIIASTEDRSERSVYNAEQRLRMYVRHHRLPVEIGRRTDDKGFTTVYAAWEPVDPLPPIRVATF